MSSWQNSKHTWHIKHNSHPIKHETVGYYCRIKCHVQWWFKYDGNQSSAVIECWCRIAKPFSNWIALPHTLPGWKEVFVVMASSLHPEDWQDAWRLVILHLCWYLTKEGVSSPPNYKYIFLALFLWSSRLKDNVFVLGLLVAPAAFAVVGAQRRVQMWV